jgi:predicted nucleic acid-binding protein
MYLSEARYHNTIVECLHAGLQNESKIFLYFDTNILLDVVDHRKQSSIDLFEFMINKENLKLVTSVFAKVEIYETKQKDEFRKQKREEGWTNEKIVRKIEKRDLSIEILASLAQRINTDIDKILIHFKELTKLLSVGWVLAEEIKKTTNLTDKDSIHLAEARMAGCDILVTRDKFLTRVASDYIWLATPDEILSIINMELDE